MRDMMFSGAILAWAYVAAHAGTSQLTGLFGIVHASLEQILAQLG